jgi:hypothetical protein
LHTSAALKQAVERSAEQAGRSLTSQIEHLVILGLTVEERLSDPAGTGYALRRASRVALAALEPVLHHEALAGISAILSIARLVQAPARVIANAVGPVRRLVEPPVESLRLTPTQKKE